MEYIVESIKPHTVTFNLRSSVEMLFCVCIRFLGPPYDGLECLLHPARLSLDYDILSAVGKQNDFGSITIVPLDLPIRVLVQDRPILLCNLQDSFLAMEVCNNTKLVVVAVSAVIRIIFVVAQTGVAKLGLDVSIGKASDGRSIWMYFLDDTIAIFDQVPSVGTLATNAAAISCLL